jgi:hypothetical protein
MPEEKQKIRWYQKKEIWGLVAVGGLTGSQFPSHTTAFKVGVYLNSLVAIGLAWFGIKDGYANDNLPSGLSKVMDMISNKITGVKGSALNNK